MQNAPGGAATEERIACRPLEVWDAFLLRHCLDQLLVARPPIPRARRGTEARDDVSNLSMIDCQGVVIQPGFKEKNMSYYRSVSQTVDCDLQL